MLHNRGLFFELFNFFFTTCKNEQVGLEITSFVLLSQIKIPDTSGVDFNFVCYGRHPKTIEYGFIKIFVYIIRGSYGKRTLIKSIFYTSEIVWSTIP